MKLFFLYLTLLLDTQINVQWWNPLAEKIYDTCVLENIKNSIGKDAVLTTRNRAFD